MSNKLIQLTDLSSWEFTSREIASLASMDKKGEIHIQDEYVVNKLGDLLEPVEDSYRVISERPEDEKVVRVQFFSELEDAVDFLKR